MRKVTCLMLALLVLPTIANIVRAQDETGFELSGPTMGTTYHLCIPPVLNPDFDQSDFHRLIDDNLADFEKCFSTYDKNAELAQVNNSSSRDWIPISRDLYMLLSLSRELTEKTSGAFDIAVGPLVNRWQQNSVPTETELKTLCQRCGNDAWELRSEPFSVRKKVDGVAFNVNAIAPGYVVDRLAEVIDQEDVGIYQINLGGEVYCGDSRIETPGPWGVMVEEPVKEGRHALYELPVSKSAVATSGDYRQQKTINGKTYGHIIDPRTGQPVEHEAAAVTVVAATCAEADAWATALFVLGPEKGLQVANQHSLVACYAMKDDGVCTIAPSRRFAQQFPLVIQEHEARKAKINIRGLLKIKQGGVMLASAILLGCVVGGFFAYRSFSHVPPDSPGL